MLAISREALHSVPNSLPWANLASFFCIEFSAALATRRVPHKGVSSVFQTSYWTDSITVWPGVPYDVQDRVCSG
ncbi:hypothetical protein GYMLUDRAFT_408338 [Collybiopsis luxurians FD-317 M1]|uniref:Uncharacterized protein n=1 Tax=Collybiopsis luxurians FD-317 M1 TaxID=944289 RepID=A0A0D0C8J6_9AGAR|nr:hypothetical protein GYMLUDRAFT_408338 [Collybiopsis luxurians FD-317 M1]